MRTIFPAIALAFASYAYATQSLNLGDMQSCAKSCIEAMRGKVNCPNFDVNNGDSLANCLCDNKDKFKQGFQECLNQNKCGDDANRAAQALLSGMNCGNEGQDNSYSSGKKDWEKDGGSYGNGVEDSARSHAGPSDKGRSYKHESYGSGEKDESPYDGSEKGVADSNEKNESPYGGSKKGVDDSNTMRKSSTYSSHSGSASKDDKSLEAEDDDEDCSQECDADDEENGAASSASSAGGSGNGTAGAETGSGNSSNALTGPENSSGAAAFGAGDANSIESGNTVNTTTGSTGASIAPSILTGVFALITGFLYL